MSTPIHGNYHGYYLKRPSTSDSRLALVSSEVDFKNKMVLDVGCNEGFVTCEIAQTLGARHVVGVDIDESLIRAAWRKRTSTWSLQGPPDPETNKKRKRDDPVANSKSFGPPNYFPASLEHTLGPLPIPPSNPETEALFPHNVNFRVADWVKNRIPEDKDGYDVVFGLSITKWIHLNEGDEGIREFFRRVKEVLTPGGILILEPQDWENYARAKRLDKKLKENMQRLELRPADFGRILCEDLGFALLKHFDPSGEGGFNRPIDIYSMP